LNVKIFTDLIEKQGLKPMKNVIESLGGWPMIEGKNWASNSWFWQKITLKLELLGFSTNQVFAVSIDVDMKNSSRRILYVS
jgi:neprilysin